MIAPDVLLWPNSKYREYILSIVRLQIPTSPFTEILFSVSFPTETTDGLAALKVASDILSLPDAAA